MINTILQKKKKTITLTYFGFEHEVIICLVGGFKYKSLFWKLEEIRSQQRLGLGLSSVAARAWFSLVVVASALYNW